LREQIKRVTREKHQETARISVLSAEKEDMQKELLKCALSPEPAENVLRFLYKLPPNHLVAQVSRTESRGQSYSPLCWIFRAISFRIHESHHNVAVWFVKDQNADQMHPNSYPAVWVRVKLLHPYDATKVKSISIQLSDLNEKQQVGCANFMTSTELDEFCVNGKYYLAWHRRPRAKSIVAAHQTFLPHLNAPLLPQRKENKYLFLFRASIQKHLAIQRRTRCSDVQRLAVQAFHGEAKRVELFEASGLALWKVVMMVLVHVSMISVKVVMQWFQWGSEASCHLGRQLHQRRHGCKIHNCAPTHAPAHARTPLSQLPSPPAPSQRATTAFIAAQLHHTTQGKHSDTQSRQAHDAEQMTFVDAACHGPPAIMLWRAMTARTLLSACCSASASAVDIVCQLPRSWGLGVGGWDLRFGVRDWGSKQADDITQHLAARRAMAGPLMLAVAEEQGVVWGECIVDIIIIIVVVIIVIITWDATRAAGTHSLQQRGFRVWGLGFGVWGLGPGVWGLGLRVWGLGFGVQTCSKNVSLPQYTLNPVCLRAESDAWRVMRDVWCSASDDWMLHREVTWYVGACGSPVAAAVLCGWWKSRAICDKLHVTR